MENLLFTYNIILTIFFTIALTGYYIVYMKSKRRGFLFLSLLFFLMIIDNSIIYISEFSSSFGSLYETSDILYIVIDLIYFGIIVTIRLIISHLFQDPFTTREKQLCIVVPIILLILSIVAPFQVSELLIYLSFYATLSYLALRLYRHMNCNTEEFSERRSKAYSVFLFVSILLSFLGIVESGFYFMSYLSDPYLSSSPLSLEYRSVAFDIIKLLIFVIGIKNLYNCFENLFDQKDVSDKSTDEKLNEFCIKYSLTSRQREIIELIIEGYSNKEISTSLHITEGTVKTHIYNIFKKTDISSRNQIMKKIMQD
ncbi:response regulator transcription factor [Vallitalea okinawensis]|uniref:response regulator transcription factor n=1 Tax=Vallitalea okinawensis TaxID=2078660 RepID=UPI0014792754|nr:helix-turn-helix transcriptional regulator [Vallitalea okinawensis]